MRNLPVKRQRLNSTSRALDFPHHLRDYLQRVRDDVSSHDVVFIVGNERFSAHRSLVAAASPVLQKMLTNGMKETYQREIPLKDLNVDVWRVVHDYMYTGRLEIDNIENALQILECAVRFTMDKLENAIFSYISRVLDEPDFCCQVLAVMDRLNNTILRQMAMNTIVKNFCNVYCTSEFTKLSYNLVLEILSHRQLIVRSELDVFLAAMQWMVYSGINGVDSELNAKIAKQACALLKESDLAIEGLERVEAGSGDTGNYSALLQCVDLNNLSDTDLRRMVRFCRRFWKQVQTNHNIDLVHVQEFSEKAVEQQLAAHNSIPNVLVLPRFRVPRGRYDKIFSFSHRIHDLRKTDSPLIPVFVDKLRTIRWYVQVYFGGFDGDLLGCSLYREVENYWEEEAREFNAQMYLEVDNNDGYSSADVFWETSENAILQRCPGRELQEWGHDDLASFSKLEGHDTIIVGATLYFK